jgi:histone H2A
MVKNKAVSRSSRAKLTFPIGRIGRIVKSKKYTPRAGGLTPVYIAAIAEYLISELIRESGNAAILTKKKRITPKHISMVLSNDEEFTTFFEKKSIYQGGSPANLQIPLYPSNNNKKTRKRAKTIPIIDEVEE